jgi:hypothetical protein
MSPQSASTKARSPLSFYSQKMRGQIRKEMPELNIMEINKELAKRWNKVTKKKKEMYIKKAKADIERVNKLYSTTPKKATKKKATKKKATKKKATKKKATKKKATKAKKKATKAKKKGIK